MHWKEFKCLNIQHFIVVIAALLCFGLIRDSAAQMQIVGFQVQAECMVGPNCGSEGTASLGKQLSDGSSIVFGGERVTLRLFGSNLTNGSLLSFTKQSASYEWSCASLATTVPFTISTSDSNGISGIVTVALDMISDSERYYICASTVGNAGDPRFLHQGNASWLRIATKEPYTKHYLLPWLWLQIIVIGLLLVLSGLFSGLNLGLMSLDKTELDIMINSGTAKEKKYAKKIRPLRKRGNFLLCTILLGNVMVNNTLTILTDDLTGSGVAAVVAATLAIVIFGEIIPQAVCSRYGLAVGARTSWFTRFFMLLTFPLSYPISRVLDCILGEEIGNVYNRDRLRELLRLTENEMDLVKDEMNIITGALELSKKTVSHVMTKLEDVFMVESEAVLDFDTMNLIMKTGYTRIPIYEKERSNIVALLNIKDLAFIDPDDRTPLKTVTRFYKHPVNFVFEDTRLDVMLEEFKNGRSHLALVQRVNSEGPGDPFYEIVGVVTLEDIIEEIFQCEIIDESDTVYDNRKKAPRVDNNVKDFSVFNQPDQYNYIRLSPQLALATFQFLSTSIDPFKSDLISESVLQKLIRQDVIVNLRLIDPDAEESFLYRTGKHCDYFIMILQGRVQVTFGKENLIFEAGPFAYFGVQALTAAPLYQSTHSLVRRVSQTSLMSSINDQNSSQPYQPDFTVRAITDLQYLCIKRSTYLVARRATMMERQPKKEGSNSSPDNGRLRGLPDQFDPDWNRAALGVPGRKSPGEIFRTNSESKLPTGSGRSIDEKSLNFTRTRAESESVSENADDKSSNKVKEEAPLVSSKPNRTKTTSVNN